MLGPPRRVNYACGRSRRASVQQLHTGRHATLHTGCRACCWRSSQPSRTLLRDASGRHPGLRSSVRAAPCSLSRLLLPWAGLRVAFFTERRMIFAVDSRAGCISVQSLLPMTVRLHHNDVVQNQLVGRRPVLRLTTCQV